MAEQHRQIRCRQDEHGRLQYMLGNITLTCSKSGSVVIAKRPPNRDELSMFYNGQDGEDLMAAFVAYNQLLLEHGCGIHTLDHTLPAKTQVPRGNN